MFGSESLYGSFLNSHVLVKWKQSWMRVNENGEAGNLYESFLNSYVLVKQGHKLYGSWEERVICMWVSSTLTSWSNENKSCVGVDWQASFYIPHTKHLQEVVLMLDQDH